MDEEISQRQPEVGFLAQANTCAISCSVSLCASLSLCVFVSQCVVVTVSLWLDFCPSIPPQVLCPCLCYAHVNVAASSYAYVYVKDRTCRASKMSE